MKAEGEYEEGDSGGRKGRCGVFAHESGERRKGMDEVRGGRSSERRECRKRVWGGESGEEKNPRVIQAGASQADEQVVKGDEAWSKARDTEASPFPHSACALALAS